MVSFGKLYGCVLVCIVLIGLALASAASVKRNRILFPILSLSFFAVDLVCSGYAFVRELLDPYGCFFWGALESGVFDLTVIPLLILYVVGVKKSRKQGEKVDNR